MFYSRRSQADPKIENLAKLTGGKSFYVNEKTESLVDQYFRDALESVLSYQPASASENVVVPVLKI